MPQTKNKKYNENPSLPWRVIKTENLNFLYGA